MALTLIPQMMEFLVQTCALGLIVVGALILFITLARLMAGHTWWQGWGKPDSD